MSGKFGDKAGEGPASRSSAIGRLLMLRLERRATPSSTMSVVSPLLAAAGMLVTGFLLFSALGKDPVEAFYLFFIKPLSTSYGIGELLLKTTPLLLCGLGLALGFRANVWNIGAEGQLTMGAIAGGGVALLVGAIVIYFSRCR